MHLNERLAEYIYEELPPAEMAEAHRHVGVCAECKARVEDFQRIHRALKAMPDEDLPRRIVVAAAPVRSGHRWMPFGRLAPLVAAAALILAVVLAPPIRVDWQDSQLTIALGEAAGIASAISREQQDLLRQEIARLEKLIVENSIELRQVHGQIGFLENRQQVLTRETDDTVATIQLIAQRLEE